MDLRLNRNVSVGILSALAFLTVGCAPEDELPGQTTESTTVSQGALSAAESRDESGERGGFGRGRCPRDLPATLNPPADATLVSVLAASGVQIYTCAASPTGAPAAWTLTAPHAVLSNRSQVAAIHFAGPSWQATDGSLVVGQRIASAPSPDVGAIAWLSLKGVPNGAQGIFGDVSLIQRLNTEEGIAPATGCDDMHLDAKVLVPYRADYFFYHPAASGARVRQCASR